MSIKISAFVACLIGIYVLLCSQVDSKPLVRLNAKKILNSQYDLLALPSGENRQVVTYEPRPQYVVQESPEHQQQNQARQEVYYVQADQSSMEQAEPNRHYHHSGCSHDTTANQEAQAQANGGDEQTEEILYTDDNGNLYKRVGDHYEPASATTSLVPVSEQSEDANPSKSRNNQHNQIGMTATILTEVPVRDLPDHVLEQLKMDYGAKVIATRDYPGANLVINCGDVSSQEMSICSKHRQTSNSNYLSYPLLKSTLDEHAEHDAETQPEVEHENEGSRNPEKSEHMPEPSAETYETTEKIEPENSEGSYGYRGASAGQDEQSDASASTPKLTTMKNDEESSSNTKETESESAEKTQQDDSNK